MLRAPQVVPAINPSTGVPNEELGYAPTRSVVLQPAVPQQPVEVIGVPVDSAAAMRFKSKAA